MIALYIPLALMILYLINYLTNALCIQKEIPEDRQMKVFRTINILVTILLVSSYIEVMFT
jgi:hypothetical protein